VDFFSFSLDGATRATNDRIRGQGSYDACVAGIRQASSRGFSTSLIYTVGRFNLHELETMAPLLREWGVSRFFIQVIGLRGKSANGARRQGPYESPQVSRRQWLDTVPSVARMVADLGIPVTYPKVFLSHDEEFVCAGRVADNYFIFPNGRVYRCPLCEDFPIHSLMFVENRLVPAARLNERDFFQLNIPEGCVMNKLIQPQNLVYDRWGQPQYKIGCCLLKEEIAKK
jgi:MoaA/NifB/PqqE/SkfB family radical SAM enzyme